MLPMLLGLVALFILLSGLKSFVAAPPKILVRRVKQMGGLAVLAGALLLVLRGQIDFALAAAGFGLWLMGMNSSFSLSALPYVQKFWPGVEKYFVRRPASGLSRIRTAMLDMEIAPRSGVMSGTVLAGPDAGHTLAGLDLTRLQRLYSICLENDGDGARLLEMYFDSRFPRWRDTGQHEGNARGRSAGGLRAASIGMTEQEACEILGLLPQASAHDIRRAHRTLMKKFHPDHGGATEIAARVNQAKDILMRRHT